MTLDLDIIRELLEKIEAHDRFSSEPLSFDANQFSNPHEKALVEHCEILLENGLIEGRKVGSRDFLGIVCLRLKLPGHTILDGMRNNTIWNKIKDTAKSLGIEGLKQIPALAINLVLTGSI